MTAGDDDKFSEVMEAEQDLIEAAIITHAAKMQWLRSPEDLSDVAGEEHADAQLELYAAAHDFIDACDAAALYTLDSDDGHDVFRRIMADPK